MSKIARIIIVCRVCAKCDNRSASRKLSRIAWTSDRVYQGAAGVSWNFPGIHFRIRVLSPSRAGWHRLHDRTSIGRGPLLRRSDVTRDYFRFPRASERASELSPDIVGWEREFPLAVAYIDRSKRVRLLRRSESPTLVIRGRYALRKFSEQPDQVPRCVPRIQLVTDRHGIERVIINLRHDEREKVPPRTVTRSLFRMTK